MENPKTPETQEARTPDKTLEEASGLFSFSENFTGFASDLDFLVESNGQGFDDAYREHIVGNDAEASKALDGVRGKSLNGENMNQAGSLEDQVDGDLVYLGDFVDEDVENGENVRNGQGMNENVDSMKKIDVSGDSISLYIDFSGSLSGFNEEEKGEKLTETPVEENENGENSNNQELEFSVGDFVWVKTKANGWWPGKIYDPTDGLKHSLENDQKKCLLVGYFGNSNVSWCSLPQLKPFNENFEKMLCQNKVKAKGFVGAVEKALNKFKESVKLEMTCSCILKRNRVLIPCTKYGNLYEFSRARFEPVRFLSQLKQQALVVSSPSMLELAAVKGRLSSIHSFLGHSQLPMKQLLKIPESNIIAAALEKGCKIDTSIEEEKSENGFDLRERKKSKYLSYPYVNLRDKEAPNNEVPDKTEGDKPQILSFEADDARPSEGRFLSGSKYRSKRFQKTLFEKFGRESSTGSNPEFINATASKLLSDLHLTAVDSQYQNECKNFDITEWFFIRFRISVYHDELVYGAAFESALSGSHSEETKPISNNTNTKSKKKKRENSTHTPDVVGIGVNEKTDTLTETKIEQKTHKKKRGSYSLKSKIKSLSGLSDVSIKIAADDMNLQQAKDIPDLNANGITPTFLVEDSKLVTSAGESEGNKREKEAPFECIKTKTFEVSINSTPLSDLQESGPCLMNATSAKDESCADLPDPNGNDDCKALVTNDSLVEATQKHKKARKVKSQSDNNVINVPPAGIPDLNRTSGEPILLEKNVQDTTCQPEPKTKRKYKDRSGIRGRKKPAIRIPNPNFINGESLGAVLLLTFATGVPVPSREALVATCSGFGPLNELETEFLKDPCMAQVVFRNRDDAEKAVNSLEKSNPFGNTLISFKLYKWSNDSESGKGSAIGGKASSASTSGPPPVDFIRQNLEMMTAMLEKSGSNISPEMRAKLEGEIKNLLKKVSDMPCT